MNRDILKKLFYDPKFGLSSKNKFKQKVKAIHPEMQNKKLMILWYFYFSIFYKMLKDKSTFLKRDFA
jgi:hypothetical protein